MISPMGMIATPIRNGMRQPQSCIASLLRVTASTKPTEPANSDAMP